MICAILRIKYGDVDSENDNGDDDDDKYNDDEMR